jgi:hypothetical protein
MFFCFLKEQCHEIFDPRFFHQNNLPLAPIQGLKPFRIWIGILHENRFENRQNWIPQCQWHRGIQIFCQSSPLIFRFSNSYMHVMFTYRYLFISFCYGFPSKGMRANNLFREGSRGIIKISSVSLRLRNLLQKCSSRSTRSHWNRRVWSLSYN